MRWAVLNVPMGVCYFFNIFIFKFQVSWPLVALWYDLGFVFSLFSIMQLCIRQQLCNLNVLLSIPKTVRFGIGMTSILCKMSESKQVGMQYDKERFCRGLRIVLYCVLYWNRITCYLAQNLWSSILNTNFVSKQNYE